MARDEHTREDLLREATALTRRAQFRLPNCDLPYLVGFRSNGAASLFCGEDPVYQFSANNQLRRGFFQGDLLKSDSGLLYRLRRERTDEATLLVRSDFKAKEQTEYLSLLADHRSAILSAIRHDKLTLIGQVPEGDDVMYDIGVWLDSLTFPIKIASSPRVG